VVDYYRGSGYDKKYLSAIKSGATRDELNDMATGDMRKALEQASYVVPVGMGANALRLAYKAYTAGKKAIGLAKTGQKTVQAASQARKNKLITAGEQRAINREAALKAQRAANRAKTAQKKANTAGKMAVGAGAVGLVANSISKSGTKPTGPTTKEPKLAPSPNTPGGNIGRTLTKYDGKARVAPKPQDNTKKKKNTGKSGMGMEAYQRRTGSKR